MKALQIIRRRVALVGAAIARTAWAVAGFVREELGLREVLVIGGLASVGHGIHLIHQPAAWIVVGAVVFLLGVRR